MGRWTLTAVAKFKLKDINWNNPTLNNILVKLREEGYERGDGLGISWDDDGMIIPVVKNEWKYYYDNGAKYEDHNGNELYCDTMEKGDIELFVVDESFYDGGDGCYCVFGDSLEAIEQLCDDWDLTDYRITENYVVQHTS